MSKDHQIDTDQPITLTQDGWEITGHVKAEYYIDGHWRDVTDRLDWFMTPDEDGELAIPSASIPVDWDIANLRVAISSDRWEYDEEAGRLVKVQPVG